MNKDLPISNKESIKSIFVKPEKKVFNYKKFTAAINTNQYFNNDQYLLNDSNIFQSK